MNEIIEFVSNIDSNSITKLVIYLVIEFIRAYTNKE